MPSWPKANKRLSLGPHKTAFKHRVRGLPLVVYSHSAHGPRLIWTECWFPAHLYRDCQQLALCPPRVPTSPFPGALTAPFGLYFTIGKGVLGEAFTSLYRVTDALLLLPLVFQTTKCLLYVSGLRESVKGKWNKKYHTHLVHDKYRAKNIFDSARDRLIKFYGLVIPHVLHNPLFIPTSLVFFFPSFFSFFLFSFRLSQWHVPIISTTLEAETGKLRFQVSLSSENVLKSNVKNW